MIKNCKKCNKEFDSYSKWGEKQFCSRKCSNSRIFSEESKIKKSIANKGKVLGPRGGLTEQQYEDKIQKYKKTVRKRLLETSFEELGFDRKRLRVFIEQNESCCNCGLSEWMNEPITLELEHIDGNNKNNKRDNLKGLCPNCHSLTNTWRGRNKNKHKKIEDDILKKCLLETINVRQGLLKAGLTAKGNNYIRAKKLLT
jgi:hypothetical protein